MSVTRYTVGLKSGAFVCEINPDGNWIDYDEHAARCQEINDKWALEKQALEAALRRIASHDYKTAATTGAAYHMWHIADSALRGSTFTPTPPYPWCRQPSVCRGTCPMDPSCGE